MERPRTLDPTECKHAIRHLNGTADTQLIASIMVTFFCDIQNQRFLETKQPPYSIPKLNIFHYGASASITNSQLVLNATPKKAVCWEHDENVIEDSCSLIVREIGIIYDDEDKKLVYHGHTLPCLHNDGFCKHTILTPFTCVCKELCLFFSVHSFNGRMSKLNNRYWLEPEHFYYNNISKVPIETPYLDSNSQNRSFWNVPERKLFCGKPTLLYTTEYPDIFITYKHSTQMHAGKRNPLQLPEDEQNDRLTTHLMSEKLIHTQHIFFLPLNPSNNFAAIAYAAHV